MRTIVSIMMISLLTGSCRYGFNRVHGSGNVIKQEVNVKGFAGIEASGPMDVEVKMGDSYKVTIETDDNVARYFEVRRNGEDLEIRLKDGVNIEDGTTMKVYVETPVLKSIQVAGSGNVRGIGVIENSNRIDIDVAGSGDVFMELKSPEVKTSVAGSGKTHIKGSTRKLDVSIAGSGDVDAEELKSEGVEVTIGGSGNVKLYASMSLNVSIAGSGDVIYWGNPEIIQSIVGSGSIRKGD